MFLFKQVLVFTAQRHDRRHIHLVIGGQHRGSILRLFQPPRDGLAQAGHLDPFLPRGIGHRHWGAWGNRRRCQGKGRCRCRGRRRNLSCNRRQNIRFHHPAIFARGRNGIARQVIFGHQFFGRRGILDILGSRGSHRVHTRCRCGLCPGSFGRFRRYCPFADRGQQRRHAHSRAFGGNDFGQRARHGRWHLDRHLVGFQLAQHVIHCHRIAGFLEPCGDRRLGHTFAQSGHSDLNAHGAFPSMVSASFTRAACCALCMLANPVAGEADAARPA